MAPSPTALVDALSAWFAGLGDRGGAAVFLDDLQWADSATVELLARLAADLASVPVVVIAAYRQDEVTRGHPVRKLRVVLRRSGRLAEIEVEPLDAAGTAELAARILEAPVAPSLVAVLHDRTQGIPFFVEELVAALTAEGMLAPGPDGLEVRAGEEIPVPDSVRDAILLRAEQLSDPARLALEAAAVAGHRFELDVVEELGAAADFEEASALGFVAEVEPGARCVSPRARPGGRLRRRAVAPPPGHPRARGRGARSSRRPAPARRAALAGGRRARSCPRRARRRG